MDALFPPEIRELSYTMVHDKSTKTSDRVVALAMYIFLRTCDIIDYWFPITPVNKTQ